MKITRGFYQTRDGRKAWVYARKRYPMQGEILYPCGWVPTTWTISGKYRVGFVTGEDLVKRIPSRKRKAKK